MFKYSVKTLNIECSRFYRRKKCDIHSPKCCGQVTELRRARGYLVSTVGLDQEMVREYTRNQEKQDEHREQLKFGIQPPWVQIIALR
jgi:hypothetical protein